MLEAKPCPFCGEKDIRIKEGSTFRWMLAECSSCGATCGEVRVQTMGAGRPEDWKAKAEQDVIAEWNKRAGSTVEPNATAPSEAEFSSIREERDQLARELLTPQVFSRLLEWLREPEPRRAVHAFTAGIERQIAYALEADVLPEVKRLRKQVENLREIELAARNLCDVKGRHHSEIAMRRLMDACGKL